MVQNTPPRLHPPAPTTPVDAGAARSSPPAQRQPPCLGLNFTSHFLNKFLYMQLRGAERKSERSRPLGHSPNVQSGWGRASARASSQRHQPRAPVWAAGTQLLEPSLLPPRDCIGEKLESGAWVLQSWHLNQQAEGLTSAGFCDCPILSDEEC